MMYLKSLEPVVNKVPADLKPGEKVTGPVINLGVKQAASEAPKKAEKAAKKTSPSKSTAAKKTTKKK